MSNKKLFNLALATPSDSKRIAFGDSGATANNMTIGAFKAMIIASLPPPPAIVTTSVNIGGWDMRNGSGKDVSLGVDLNKIRGIQVIIKSNGGDFFPITFPNSNWELSAQWKLYNTPTANAKINIYAKNNYWFDQSGFGGTSTNRGFIVVHHTP